MEKIKTKIIQIGNSQGIRIPKHVLERLNLHDKIELVVDENTNQIHIKSADVPRHNWEESFQKMHKKGEDQLLINDSLELVEWDW